MVSLLDGVDEMSEKSTSGARPPSPNPPNLPLEQDEAVNLATVQNFPFEVTLQGELREIPGVGTVLVSFSKHEKR